METEKLCLNFILFILKPKAESILGEIEYVKSNIVYQLRNIDRLVKPNPVEKSIATLFDDAFFIYEPHGVVLIIGAWNYPVQLILGPLVGAISAGNCAIIKPSEVSPATSNVISELLPRYLDKVKCQLF